MKRLIFCLIGLPFMAQAQVDVSFQQIASGFTRPCEIVNAGDERLFVVEQVGRIKILYTDGTQIATPFLNIQPSVVSAGGEQGLLGLAFPPDYCTSGFYYVNYTTSLPNSTGTRISRFSVDPENENLTLAGSEVVLLEFVQDFSNHNGGQLEFGPDGYLYIGSGDGGSGGDPNNRAQNRNSYLGKLLRIDVSTEPYSIPSDNPFVGEENMLPEIWAYGLRNPWKFAFDDANGDLFIGDVGQDEREEVSYAAAGEGAGNNYGWRCYEGNVVFNTSQCANVGELVDPIFDYTHSSQGNGSRCSVTGGRVYRGPSFPALQGKYIFADFCSGEYWTIANNGGELTGTLHGVLPDRTVAFGADVWGEMYVVRSSNNSVSRVLEASGELRTQLYMPDFSTLQTDLVGDNFIWTLNGEIIEGATGASITPEMNGEYGLTVISATGCSIEHQPFTVTTVSTVDRELVKNLKLFPNPASDEVKIELELTQPATSFSVELYSLDGKKIKNFQSLPYRSVTSLSVEQVNPGLYLLILKTADGSILARQSIVIAR